MQAEELTIPLFFYTDTMGRQVTGWKTLLPFHAPNQGAC